MLPQTAFSAATVRTIDCGAESVDEKKFELILQTKDLAKNDPKNKGLNLENKELTKFIPRIRKLGRFLNLCGVAVASRRVRQMEAQGTASLYGLHDISSFMQKRQPDPENKGLSKSD